MKAELMTLWNRPCARASRSRCPRHRKRGSPHRVNGFGIFQMASYHKRFWTISKAYPRRTKFSHFPKLGSSISVEELWAGTPFCIGLRDRLPQLHAPDSDLCGAPSEMKWNLYEKTTNNPNCIGDLLPFRTRYTARQSSAHHGHLPVSGPAPRRRTWDFVFRWGHGLARRLQGWALVSNHNGWGEIRRGSPRPSTYPWHHLSDLWLPKHHGLLADCSN